MLATDLKSDALGHIFYAQKIWDTFPPSSRIVSSEPQPAGLVEQLTEREPKTLQIMALGSTNKEIARQLIITPGTVKAHATSIYRKLDVANRPEAVARARHLGILL